MATRMQASALSALAGTAKTTCGNIQLPAGAKRIVGFYGYVHQPGLTTLEMASGILEIESDDMSITPMQIPLNQDTMTTSGAVSQQVKMFPVDIPLPQGAAITLKGYMTLDMALTTVEKGRWGVVTDV